MPLSTSAAQPFPASNGQMCSAFQSLPPYGSRGRPGACEDTWNLAIYEAQSRVLELVAKAQPLDRLLKVLITEIEALSEASCSILLLNEAKTHLVLGAAPSFPQGYQDFLESGLLISPKDGTCGPAIFRRQSVEVFDVSTDPLWDSCRDIPLSYGFHAYWSSPILDGDGNPLGTFAMVYSKPQNPTRLDRQLVAAATYLAGIAIERHRADEQLRRLNTDLELQVKQRTVQLQRSLEWEALLNRITDKVRMNLDEVQILQAAVQELGHILGVLACEASIYDPTSGTRTVQYEYSVLPSRIGQVEDLSSFSQFPTCWLQASSPSSERTTVVICLIEDEQRIIGDLCLFKFSEENFEEAEIALTRQVANQCAIALRQARLYAASQQQVSELERLNQLKDDFLSTVSHELRTPITNIKMVGRMLQTNPPEPQRKKYLDILNYECQRESELINDLLDLQRLESSTAELEKTDQLNLTEAIVSLIEPFQARVQQRHQQLTVNLQLGLPLLVTHSSSFERVLSELLNNACKYTPAEGRIEVAVKRFQSGTQFIIRNESSIPSGELERIFQKFYRIPHADPWKQGGTGLGLALVKKLVERLGGTIEVVSCRQWATFILML
ncbi:GAF domain-containing sensor histidine kinase [Leptolyngbya sp. PL-A3]|uniref:GAF domain-containing sensor histidine kinase n=2 Tax=Leptolyngbya TaxID=47251 RepID=UPI003296AF53